MTIHWASGNNNETLLTFIDLGAVVALFLVWQFIWLPNFSWLRDYRNRNIRKRFVWMHLCESWRGYPVPPTCVSVPVLEHPKYNPRSCDCWVHGNDFLEIRYQVSGWGKSLGLVFYRGHVGGYICEHRRKYGIVAHGGQLQITDLLDVTRVYNEWVALRLFVPFMREDYLVGRMYPSEWETIDKALVTSLSELQTTRGHALATLECVKATVAKFDAYDRLPYSGDGNAFRYQLNALLRGAAIGYEKTIDPKLLETPLERRKRERQEARRRQSAKAPVAQS